MKRRTIDIPIETDDDTPDREGGEETMGKRSEKRKQDHAHPENEAAAEDRSAAESEPGAEAARELEETMDHLKRLQAEFDNYRRRTDRERQETAGWAQAMLMERLLPVLDDLERAADAIEDRDASVVQGFLLVRDKLVSVLEETGLERISAVGEAFDPNIHEALLTEPVEPERAGIVLEELVPGYTHKGRVVRPSRVKVGMETPAE